LHDSICRKCIKQANPEAHEIDYFLEVWDERGMGVNASRYGFILGLMKMFSNQIAMVIAQFYVHSKNY
jgi:hypothetical protein